jgi:hypothetical protein
MFKFHTPRDQSFFKEMNCATKMAITHNKMEKNDDQLSENLTKFGYKQDMKYKYLIILLKLLLHTQNQTWKFGNFKKKLISKNSIY